MSDRFEIASELFLAARDLRPRERREFLDRECSDDAELRREVELLLRHDRPGPFDCLVPMLGPSRQLPVPDRIGPFRILGVIGAGGMGVVYEAEQDAPRRMVALKVVRPEFVHAAAMKRFEREVEVLGRLEHPGIARIYEAGAADFGGGEQPYFAMERVVGEPLVAFCTAHRLDLEARIELLAGIADAVQHAHERGIVHRDLKPGNILVTSERQPKVVDFGVARFVGVEAAGGTLATGEGQILGTLAYMSPEQVGGTVGAIGVRSDVYALGVIGFELLSGRMPYELAGKTIPEAARVIQEEDATALGTTDKRLVGDLDTIIGKALEKDPARRYASAAELGADLRRFLCDEPISARPASTWYQLRKFGRRHRGLAAGVIAAFIALTAGGIGVTVFALREQEQRREATSAANKALAVQNLWLDTLSWADPYRTNGERLTVVEALDAAAKRLAPGIIGQPEIEAAFHHQLGFAFLRLGVGDKAEMQLSRAVELRRGLPAERTGLLDSLAELGKAQLLVSRAADSARTSREAFELARDLHGADDPTAWMIECDLARALRALGKTDDALAAAAEAEQQLARIFGAADPRAARVAITRAEIEAQRGNPKAAEVSARHAYEIASEHAVDDPSLLNDARQVLATVLDDLERPADAEPLYRSSLESYVAVLGPDHANTLNVRLNLAINLARQKHIEDALSEFTQVKDGLTRAYGPDHFQTLLATANLVSTYRDAGRAAEGLALSGEMVERARLTLTEDNWYRAYFEFIHGLTLVDAGRREEGARFLTSALPLLEKQFGPDHEFTRTIKERLAKIAPR